MNMKKSEKGHQYDADHYTSSPECEMEKMNTGFGATEAVKDGGFGGFESYGATEPVNSGSFGGNFSGSFDETEPPTKPIGSGFTEANDQWGVRQGRDGSGSVTMAAPVAGNAGFSPVVGWLVCVDGPDRGHDYRIHSGYNQIGRAEHMDICVRGDMQISREKHALIAYDDEEKIFFFGPSEGRNIVRHNGSMVMMPTKLSPYDILTIGTSKLIFVPLCGEHFDWSN